MAISFSNMLMDCHPSLSATDAYSLSKSEMGFTSVQCINVCTDTGPKVLRICNVQLIHYPWKLQQNKRRE